MRTVDDLEDYTDDTASIQGCDTRPAKTAEPVTARRTNSLSRYGWLVEYAPETPGIFVRGKEILSLFLSEAFFAVVFALPPVAKALGLSSLQAVLIVAAHFSVMVANSLLLGQRARSEPWAFHAGWIINMVAGIGAACAFPVLGGNPNTMAWSIPVLYAAINGTIADSRPSRVLLLGAGLGPILTIPAFPWGEPWTIAGPLLAGGLSACAYHYLALRTASVRALRALHDEALEELHRQREEIARMNLARDLHDSVGSTLGLLSLHAELLERHQDDAAQVARLASLAREAARGGLDDLRGVLEAIAPEKGTLASLATALEALASRAAPGIRVEVEVGEGAEKEVPGPARLVLVRGFQEALRNAVIHGRARTVQVSLTAEGGVTMRVSDDGVGFRPDAVKKGRGLEGMRARTEEAGGRFEIEARPGEGTRLLFSV